ncbi:MAG: endonuclease/exonuclease/phosphatase family protein [Candidatus Competibacteraceae bacterium]|nr:endonuclease/exonuclease/phosphatase family protein [Candidatus Competibacteraceae bacterium]
MLTIATFNLCNLGANASPSRLKRLATIIAHDLTGPAILALQEIAVARPTTPGEPVPADAAYQALITAIIGVGGPAYDYREIPPLANQEGGMSGANIRVGLLFDPARAHFSDRGAAGPLDSAGIHFSAGGPRLTLNPGRITPLHPAFTGEGNLHWTPSRKALAAEFEVNGHRLFVIVCHLKSMRSMTRQGEEHTKKQRHAQAEAIHQFAADLLTCDRQAAIAILGDFNDVPGSKTLKLLKGAGFHNLLEDQPRGQCYTRRHGSQPQALDHILISPALRRGATAHIPHVNSNAPPGQSELASDHDPVLALLPAFTVTA